MSVRELTTTDIMREAEFQFRNLVMSAPSPFTPAPLSGGTLDVPAQQTHATALRQNGMTSIPGFVAPDRLAAIRDAIEDAFAGNRPEVKIDDNPVGGNMIGYIREPLLLCDEMVALALAPDFLNIVGRYLRRRPILADVDLRRVYPTSMDHLGEINETIRKGRSSSNWHYDNRGRQVKVMIYLTDVGPDDQNFAFCPGTHRGLKFSRPALTRFPDDHIERVVPGIQEIYAAAGTALIFDTRAIHRLRRKPTQMRDTVTFYYHPGTTQFFPRHIARRHYDALPTHLQGNLLPVD